MVGIPRGSYKCLLRRQLLVEGTAGRERVGHFTERNLDRFFVLRYRSGTCTLAASRLASLAPPEKIGTLI